MMIMQPAFVTNVIIANAIAEVKKKKAPPALAKLRIARFAEDKCAQALHLGPFSEEGPMIERLRVFQLQADRKTLGAAHWGDHLPQKRQGQMASRGVH